MAEVDFKKDLPEAIQYVAIAAASTVIVGGQGAYLERVVVIPNSTGAATVTISDGSTAFCSIPAAAHAIDPHPYSVNFGLRATSASTGFKIVTGASVACVAIGKFGAVGGTLSSTA
jgi:hypothetical protein